MTLEMIETFLLISKNQSFSRTAEALFVSQSTISNRIKCLEEELNAPLFYRNGRTAILTNAGQVFAEYAEQILALSEESIATLRLYNLYKGKISISATDAMWQYYLIDSVTEFMSKDDSYSYSLLTEKSNRIIEDVISGSVILGGVLIEPFHPEIEYVKIFEDDICLVAKPGVVDEKVFITDINLRNYRYIHANWSLDFNRWFDKVFNYRNYHIEMEQSSHIIPALLRGAGIGFVPRMVAKKYLEEGSLVEIKFNNKSLPPKWIGYLIYMKKNQDDVESLVKAILNKHNEVKKP